VLIDANVRRKKSRCQQAKHLVRIGHTRKFNARAGKYLAP
jgi:hypothetical protein